MRFLFLFAALVTALNAQEQTVQGKQFKLPDGLPDGAIVTFFFWHTGRGELRNPDLESVIINFYDQPIVDLGIYEFYDITVHLRVDHKDSPQLHGQYTGAVWSEMILDNFWPKSHGYWRVDVIKHDEFQASFFFQGFWSGVRKFDKSLNNILSVYIISDFVDYPTADMRLQFPNSNIAPLAGVRFSNFLKGPHQDVKLMSFPNWPINQHIEMTVMMSTQSKRDYTAFDVPRFIFAPVDGSTYIMRMHHLYKTNEVFGQPHQLWFHSENGGVTQCTNSFTNGDLQHLYLTRISHYEIGVQVYYSSNGASGVSCVHTLSPELAKKLDEPFDIISHLGALIIHLDHSIPI